MQTELTTADGAPFDVTKEYFYFSNHQLRSTAGLELVEGFLSGEGMKLISTGNVFLSRDAAIEHGQKQILIEIDALKDIVRELEDEKSPASRTLKYIIQAR